MTEHKPNGKYDEGYKLGMAEFKGRTLQSLEDIRIEITGMKEEVRGLRLQVTNIKIISAVMGAVAAIITTVINPFRIK